MLKLRARRGSAYNFLALAHELGPIDEPIVPFSVGYNIAQKVFFSGTPKFCVKFFQTRGLSRLIKRQSRLTGLKLMTLA